MLKKPVHLAFGDKVATVSLSWGGAGDRDVLYRYHVGKERLEKQFGLQVVEMPHTLSGSSYLYAHPEKRAEDLMQAFGDPTIKAIFTCIGGNESIRLLPYIDFSLIASNPKIVLGYSDSTIAHLFCLKAGISSFYGPSILAEFAENVEIFPYTASYVKQVLFTPSPIGLITPPIQWTSEYLAWNEENQNRAKTMQDHEGYIFLQGEGVVQGRLIGGCMEVLEMAKGTTLWPDESLFSGSILFFETSEEVPSPASFTSYLRSYGTLQILQKVSAIIFGKPYQGRYYDEYVHAIRQVLAELDLSNLVVVTNMAFGHNEPMCILPYGAMAELDCTKKTFTLLESGVV